MQTTSQPSVCPLWSSVCWHQNSRESCGQAVTYPSTGHDMWSLVALPSRPLQPRLSCYKALADLTPWLDNSPFLQLLFVSKTLTGRSSLHPATGPSPTLNHWEELGLVESIKSIPETSILCRRLFQIPQHHLPVKGFPVVLGLRVKKDFLDE